MSDWDLGSLSSFSSNSGHELMRQLPPWVALEPIEFQVHWQDTAGRRPVQPPDQRKYYEQIWGARNKFFVKDSSDASGAGDNNTPNLDSSIIRNEYSIMNLRSFGYKGPYGIQITHIKILKTHALYLVKFKTPIYEFCTWQRYTYFKEFYFQIVQISGITDFIHTKLSWRLWKYRKSFFRNLSLEYLKMKAFLLERFLQDALYESNSSDLFISNFSGSVLGPDGKIPLSSRCY